MIIETVNLFGSRFSMKHLQQVLSEFLLGIWKYQSGPQEREVLSGVTCEWMSPPLSVVDLVITSNEWKRMQLIACVFRDFNKRYCGFLFKKNIYLFIHQSHRERERGRETGRGRSRLHAGSPTCDSIPGPQDHTLSQRQMLNCWASQVPLEIYHVSENYSSREKLFNI